MVAGAFYHGNGAGVAHAEALSHLAVDVQLAAGSAIQAGVSGYNIVFSGKVRTYRRQYRDASAAQSLGKIVVGVALQLEIDALNKECAEALTGRTLEAHVDCLVGKALFAVARGYLTAQHSAHRAVGILDGEVEVHLILSLNGTFSSVNDASVEHVAEVVNLLRGVVEAAITLLLMQQTAEVESRELLVIGVSCLYQLCMTHYIIELGEAHLGKIFPHFLRKEGEIVDEILITAPEMCPQARVLCGYSHRTSIEVALAHHHAAQHNEHCRAEAKLLSAEQSHEYDVATCLQLAVYLQPYLPAQAVLDERLLRL